MADSTELLVQPDMGDEIDVTVATAVDDASAIASPELGFGAGEVLKDRRKMVIFYF